MNQINEMHTESLLSAPSISVTEDDLVNDSIASKSSKPPSSACETWILFHKKVTLLKDATRFVWCESAKWRALLGLIA